MGNIISFGGSSSKDDNSLSMSNGLTDVLIDYLLISGSELAESESEKRMIVFLAEKQQTILGIGNVDFDIIEMPWQSNTFDGDKEFLLAVINHARLLSAQQSIWDKLGYKPSQNLLEYALNGFETLIKQMSVSDIDENNLKEWIEGSKKDDPIFCEFPKCPKHGILLSLFGCKFCNEGE